MTNLLLAQYKLTKVVTIYPRFIIKNDLDRDVRFRELGSKDETLLAPGQRHSLGFLRAGIEPQLVLAFPGSPTKW